MLLAATTSTGTAAGTTPSWGLSRLALQPARHRKPRLRHHTVRRRDSTLARAFAAPAEVEQQRAQLKTDIVRLATAVKRGSEEVRVRP
eukprot:scaffold7900_cov363-Prasinococcus_capsulatus_cf.AAC.1